MSKEPTTYDEFVRKQHRDDITTRIFAAMMGKYPDTDPAELVAKARAAADVLLAELAKPRGDAA